jgi:hypothetical protein
MATPTQSDPRTSSSPSNPRNPASTSGTTGTPPDAEATFPGASPGASTAGSAGYGASGRSYSSGSGTQHETAQAVKERAGALWDDAREAARSKLNEQKDVAASGIDEVAGALRDAAKRQQGNGTAQPFAQLTSSAAEGLEHLSHTLRSKDVAAMLRDMDNFARNQPVAFFGIALAAGFLAVRFLKADSTDARREHYGIDDDL